MTPCKKKGCQRNHSEGFTFVEMLMVLLLLGIVTMGGWPVLKTALADVRLSGAAEEIVTAIEFAQLSAISNRQTRVSVNAGTDTILVERFTGGADLFGGGQEIDETDVEGGSYSTMGNPMNKGAGYHIQMPMSTRFNGVDITASDFPVGNAVSFDSLGTPSKGGTITLTLNTLQKIVALNASTGTVSVSE
jgi:prepilin-type N-terminal cleavage/methylation domain-containing protein